MTAGLRDVKVNENRLMYRGYLGVGETGAAQICAIGAHG